MMLVFEHHRLLHPEKGFFHTTTFPFRCGLRCSPQRSFEPPEFLGLLTWSQHLSYPSLMILKAVMLKIFLSTVPKVRWKQNLNPYSTTLPTAGEVLNRSHQTYWGQGCDFLFTRMLLLWEPFCVPGLPLRNRIYKFVSAVSIWRWSLETRYIAELEREQEGLLLNTSPGGDPHRATNASLYFEKYLLKEGVLTYPGTLLLLPPTATFCTDYTDHILSLLQQGPRKGIVLLCFIPHSYIWN